VNTPALPVKIKQPFKDCPYMAKTGEIYEEFI